MSAQMDAILAEIREHPHVFDFDRDNLGEDAAELVAAAIFEFMESEIDPENNPWGELSEGYREWKDRHYPGRKIGERELRMKDPMELRGELDISANQLRQQYGLSAETKAEAEWFQEGDEASRPARRFYDFNDLALQSLSDLFDDHFHSKIG